MSYFYESPPSNYSKLYVVKPIFPIEVEFAYYPRRVVIESVAGTNVSQVSAYYDAKSFSSFALALSTNHTPNIYEVNLKTGFKTVSEQQVQQTLLQDFCAGTNNPADCQAKALGGAVPNHLVGIFDPTKGILIDNLCMVGFHSKIATALEGNEWTETPASEMVGAYTFLGQAIPDFEQYKGLAIIERKDGSRSKVVKH